jgi:hypothetical protein
MRSRAVAFWARDAVHRGQCLAPQFERADRHEPADRLERSRSRALHCSLRFARLKLLGFDVEEVGTVSCDCLPYAYSWFDFKRRHTVITRPFRTAKLAASTLSLLHYRYGLTQFRRAGWKRLKQLQMTPPGKEWMILQELAQHSFPSRPWRGATRTSGSRAVIHGFTLSLLTPGALS